MRELKIGVAKDFLEEFEAIIDKKDNHTILVAFSYWEQARFAECRMIMTDGIDNDHM